MEVLFLIMFIELVLPMAVKIHPFNSKLMLKICKLQPVEMQIQWLTIQKNYHHKILLGLKMPAARLSVLQMTNTMTFYETNLMMTDYD